MFNGNFICVQRAYRRSAQKEACSPTGCAGAPARKATGATPVNVSNKTSATIDMLKSVGDCW